MLNLHNKPPQTITKTAPLGAFFLTLNTVNVLFCIVYKVYYTFYTTKKNIFFRF